MKKSILLLIVLLLVSSFYSFPYRNNVEIKTEKKVAVNVKKKVFKHSLKVEATYYNPVVSQCDENPLETASTDIINLDKLQKKQIRWVACSRNLLKYWGGKLKFGDTITIVSKNKNVAGKWIIKDTMNERYKNRIDFLCSGKIKGDLKDVVIKFN